MKVKAKNVDKLVTTKKANGGQNNDSQACIYIYHIIYPSLSMFFSPHVLDDILDLAERSARVENLWLQPTADIGTLKDIHQYTSIRTQTE